MSERVANTSKVIAGIGYSMSRAGRLAAEDAQWRQGIHELFGADASTVIARADDLSWSTAMNRNEARDKAEQEMRDVYATRLRTMADPI